MTLSVLYSQYQSMREAVKSSLERAGTRNFNLLPPKTLEDTLDKVEKIVGLVEHMQLTVDGNEWDALSQKVQPGQNSLSLIEKLNNDHNKFQRILKRLGGAWKALSRKRPPENITCSEGQGTTTCSENRKRKRGTEQDDGNQKQKAIDLTKEEISQAPENIWDLASIGGGEDVPKDFTFTTTVFDEDSIDSEDDPNEAVTTLASTAATPKTMLQQKKKPPQLSQAEEIMISDLSTTLQARVATEPPKTDRLLDQKTGNIIIPSNRDVLVAGRHMPNHQGNMLYLDLVKIASSTYENMPTAKKSYVSNLIIDIIMDQGGEFIQKLQDHEGWVAIKRNQFITLDGKDNGYLLTGKVSKAILYYLKKNQIKSGNYEGNSAPGKVGLLGTASLQLDDSDDISVRLINEFGPKYPLENDEDISLPSLGDSL